MKGKPARSSNEEDCKGHHSNIRTALKQNSFKCVTILHRNGLMHNFCYGKGWKGGAQQVKEMDG